MSISLINPYYRGIGEIVIPPEPPFEFSGALVNRSGNDTTLTTMNWNAEVYDIGGWHDNATNNDRLTVPSGVSLVRLSAGIDCGQAQAGAILEIYRDDVAFFADGGARQRGRSQQTGYQYYCVATGPVQVTAGQYFTTLVSAITGATVQQDAATWFAVEALDPDTRYVRLGRTTSLSTAVGTQTTTAWQTKLEEVGDLSWADLGVNAERVVIPAGVSWVIATHFQDWTSSISTAEQVVASLRLNGTRIAERDVEGNTDTNTRNGVVSGLLAVVEGDYIDAPYFTTNSETLNTGSWLAVEEVRGTVKGCRAWKSGATQSISANTNTIISLDAEAFDTDSAHDNAVDNSRITVPSGCTRARVWWGLSIASTTANSRGFLTKNGARFDGGGEYCNETSGQNFLNGQSAWVDVTPGDYFELNYRSSAATTVQNQELTFLTVQFS